MSDKTQKYMLKDGFSHYANRGGRGKAQRLEAGAIVDLTPKQAAAFADRFELLAAVEARAAVDAALVARASDEAAAQTAAAAAAPAPEAPAAAPVAAEAPPAAPAAPPAPAEAAPAAEAPAAAPEPEAFEAVDVEEYTAAGLIELVGKMQTEGQLRQVADAEQARGSKARSTVLAAVDEKLDELEGGGS